MQKKFLEAFYRGDILAASRMMSVVEGGGEEAEAVLNALFPKVGRAYRIGVTGLTGSGKSTLVNQLTLQFRRRRMTVGVVAEDPTSPFSGGAILGDRVRMLDSAGDEGVFIRSIASRGSESGLSAVATELADVLDAFGRDVVFLETIGIGQLEYRIRYSGHTTIVVLTPDAGDDVQSLKSGLMEIGDIFVVNKSDREHASRYAGDLASMLDLTAGSREWHPPVISTVATKGEGIDDLMAAVDDHRRFLEVGDRLEQRRVESLRKRIAFAVEEGLRDLLWRTEETNETFEALLKRVVTGEKSPYEAAHELLSTIEFGDKAKGGAP